jgi:betaine-aldehyde dehydrogenase
MYIRDAFFIGGEWKAPMAVDHLDVISPATEEKVGRVPVSTAEDMDAAVDAARSAFEDGQWAHLSISERGEHLLRLAEVLRSRLSDAVNLQIDEMGSVYSFIRPVTEGMIGNLSKWVAQARQIETREIRNGYAGKVAVYRNPVGVVGSIIPWNAPVSAVLARMAIPLLAGCTVVMKPPPESPLSGYLVADAFKEIGLPPGVFNLVPGGRDVGEHLVRHPGVDKISFTGSTAAGSRVGELCGQQQKRVTMELGGKSAAIVLADADLDRHLPALISSSIPNTGQVCHATTRILAPKIRSKELVERLVDAVQQMKVGDPHETDTTIGPLASERQRQRVEGYIRTGRDEGASLAIGGGRPKEVDRGWFVEPTVFTGVDNSMTIAREEIFGPVLCVIDYEDEREAISIANDSAYGLGGAVFTADVEHGLRVAEQINTGTCLINDAPASGGGGPFGGAKHSGVGREYDREGFDSYFELKSISLPPGFTPST